MKVLFFVRANSDMVKGGDLMQIDLTAKYLRKAGIIVDYSSDYTINLSGYDIVHVFNSPRFEETKRFFEAAKRFQKPIAFSTIYWPKTEYVVGTSHNILIRAMRNLLGSRLSCWLVTKLIKVKDGIRPNRYRTIEKWLFSNADILLPNSDGEMHQITDFYNIKHRPYKAVRNAVEAGASSANTPQQRQGVLSVGRIESRKNTLKLIEACYEVGVPLTLIGGYNNDDEYAAECLYKMKQYSFVHVNNIPPKELHKYYFAAEVHAMASWYETPGLATMEAAAAGCKIVTTDRGSTTEYFGDNVAYCDPFVKDSIIKALQTALAEKPSAELKKEVLTKYTWSQTAQDTIEAYQELIS